MRVDYGGSLESELSNKEVTMENQHLSTFYLKEQCQYLIQKAMVKARRKREMWEIPRKISLTTRSCVCVGFARLGIQCRI